MTDQALREILELSAPEKLDIIGQIWDSIDDSEELQLSEEQIAELERRADGHERKPGEAIPLEKALDALRPNRR